MLLNEVMDKFVFESRLAWHFIPDSFKISLFCTLEERVSRIAGREHKPFNKVFDETLHREELIKNRYKEYYNIENFSDEKNFDFVIDTGTNNADQVVEIILNELKNRHLI
jgi:cytidylate kinase